MYTKREAEVNTGEAVTRAIEQAVEALFGDAPRATLSRAQTFYVLSNVARHVAKLAAEGALSSLVTVDRAAVVLGVSPRRVRAMARKLGVGWEVSRGVWLFRPIGLDNLATRGGLSKGRA